jgi:hypothetical protein
MISQNEIQAGINALEAQIITNSAFISLIPAFIETAGTFDSKVLNKRFIGALNEAVGDKANIYSYQESYSKDAIDFNIYLRGVHKTFRFAKNTCFSLTDSGKLRIDAEGFKKRLQEIREGLISENAHIRAEIDTVYQMLADAQELKAKVDEYQKKYSFRLMNQFKCNYHLRNY